MFAWMASGSGSIGKFMELENRTSLVAELMRAQLFYRDLIMATVICKATFEVASDGSVQLAAEQLPLVQDAVKTELGTLETDIVPIKEGCDLAIYGHARSPGRKPVLALPLRLQLGTFERSIVATGDRVWGRSLGSDGQSTPTPFVAMPLTLERAYGGKADSLGGLQEVCTDNEAGRGFVVTKEQIEGAPLPNLEELDQLLHDPRARPMPAALVALPRNSTLRGARGVLTDSAAGTAQLSPVFFNHAHPRMLLRKYPQGQIMHIDGLRHEGRWSFATSFYDLRIQVHLGGRGHELTLTPDTLTVWPDQQRFCVVARRAFVYQFLPERERGLVLFAASADRPLHEPVRTIAALKAASEARIPVQVMGDEGAILEKAVQSYPLTSIVDLLPLCQSD